MKFAHININASLALLDKEKDFCCNILGLKEGFRPNFPSKGYWLYHEDEPVIHLTETEHHLSNKSHIDHIAFYRDDKEQFLALLKANHIAYSSVYIDETSSTQIKLVSPLHIIYEIIFNDELSKTG